MCVRYGYTAEVSITLLFFWRVLKDFILTLTIRKTKSLSNVSYGSVGMSSKRKGKNSRGNICKILDVWNVSIRSSRSLHLPSPFSIDF
ncbi:hypothetical protein V6Z11_D03G118300 [Gossypium hirsutum]